MTAWPQFPSDPDYSGITGFLRRFRYRCIGYYAGRVIVSSGQDAIEFRYLCLVNGWGRRKVKALEDDNFKYSSSASTVKAKTQAHTWKSTGTLEDEAIRVGGIPKPKHLKVVK